MHERRLDRSTLGEQSQPPHEPWQIHTTCTPMFPLARSSLTLDGDMFGSLKQRVRDPLLDPIFLRHAIDHRSAVFENMEHLQGEHFFVEARMSVNARCRLSHLTPDACSVTFSPGISR